LRTEPLLYESGPLFIECWFMNGYRSHLLCRPVFIHDAKEKQSGLQANERVFSQALKIQLDKLLRAQLYVRVA